MMMSARGENTTKARGVGSRLTLLLFEVLEFEVGAGLVDPVPLRRLFLAFPRPLRLEPLGLFLSHPQQLLVLLLLQLDIVTSLVLQLYFELERRGT